LFVKLENESEIIARCCEGEIDSFREIYNHFREPLYRVAFRMIGSKEDAEDALQMMFIKLYQNIKQFRGQSKLSTYLYQILLHTCYDLRRSKKIVTNQPLKETDLFYKPQNELQLQLEEALQQLPDKMKECFVLFAIEGFKQFEIAEIMGISTGTVKAHIFQAKEKLRDLLSERESEVAH
jgi:RNA polymerase sigma-70 factor (ECF subfamily)